MTTIRDYINKAKFVSSEMLNQQERIILANESQIISLNVDALQNGQGSDGKILKNSNKIFKGVYTLATQLTNERKIAGNPYDFLETGSFLGNFQIEMQPNLTKFDIFSTGTGSGDKSIFFAGYANLYGLDKENTDFVNYQIVLPELLKFIKQYL